MADKLRILQQQLAAAVETTLGEAVTLTSSHVKLKPFQSEFNYAPDRLRFTNDEVADDIGMAADFTAGAKASIGVGFGLKTGGVVGTAPAAGTFLQGCGLQAEVVNAITIGAPTGGVAAFAAGDVYSAATGTKTGVIEYPISAGGTLRYVVTTGGALAAADVVAVGSVTATASGSNALYATKYRPTSFGLKGLSMRRAIKNSEGTSNKDFVALLRGAMGDGSIELAALDAARFKGTFTGVIVSEGDGALLTGYTYETGVPPTFANATVQLNGVAVQPDAVSLAFGNSVEMDPDPTTTGGAAGYQAANISSRKPSISIAPYRQIASVLDDLGLYAGGTTFPVVVRFGTTPNLIEIVAPKAQITGWTQGDRAGFETAQLTLSLTRDTLVDHEYAIYFR